MNREYAEKVEVLLRLLPIVMEEKVFAVHGGSAINLFVRNLPRYSVDIDLTYIPLEGREESLEHINAHLMSIAGKAKRAFPGMHIVPKLNTCKLLCEYQRKQIKVEVNQTKRGIVGGDVLTVPLCKKAQDEFGLYCEADIVPMTLLYGGKIAAALSRQHHETSSMSSTWSTPLKRHGRACCSAFWAATVLCTNHLLPTLLTRRMHLPISLKG